MARHDFLVLSTWLFPETDSEILCSGKLLEQVNQIVLKFGSLVLGEVVRGLVKCQLWGSNYQGDSLHLQVMEDSLVSISSSLGTMSQHEHSRCLDLSRQVNYGFWCFWSRAYSSRQEHSDSGKISETNVIWKKRIKKPGKAGIES